MISFSSDKSRVKGVAVSSIGGRLENQDDFCCLDTPLGYLVIVCDGMGGGPGGKTASNVVKREIAAVFASCSISDTAEYLFKKAAAGAQDALQTLMERNQALQGMGSTFVALLFNQEQAVVAHAGDSRCYLFRGKKCVFRTADHSLVAELVRSKALTEEEARRSPQSNIITRGLGAVSNNVPDIDYVPFRKGDRFVLCTDGVWGLFTAHDLTEKLTARESLAVVVERTDSEIDVAGKRAGGGHDNHTLIMVEPEYDSQKKPTPSYNSLSLWAAICIAAALLIWGIVALSLHLLKDDKVVSGQTTTHVPTPETGLALVHGTEPIVEQTPEEVISTDSLRRIAQKAGLIATPDSGNRTKGSSAGNTESQPEPKQSASQTVSVKGLSDLLKEFKDGFAVDENEGQGVALDCRNKKVTDIKGYAEKLKLQMQANHVTKGLKTVEKIEIRMGKANNFPIDKAKQKKYRLTETARDELDELIKELNS